LLAFLLAVIDPEPGACVTRAIEALISPSAKSDATEAHPGEPMETQRLRRSYREIEVKF